MNEIWSLLGDPAVGNFVQLLVAFGTIGLAIFSFVSLRHSRESLELLKEQQYPRLSFHGRLSEVSNSLGVTNLSSNPIYLEIRDGVLVGSGMVPWRKGPAPPGDEEFEKSVADLQPQSSESEIKPLRTEPRETKFFKVVPKEIRWGSFEGWFILRLLVKYPLAPGNGTVAYFLPFEFTNESGRNTGKVRDDLSWHQFRRGPS